MMQYKGYLATTEVDAEADLIHGEVLGIRDVVTFQGRSPREALQAFHDSVDDYLDFCKKRGEQPDKPFSGKFMLRVDPVLHRMISTLAESSGTSLNSWVLGQLMESVRRHLSLADEAPKAVGSEATANSQPFQARSRQAGQSGQEDRSTKRSKVQIGRQKGMSQTPRMGQ